MKRTLTQRPLSRHLATARVTPHTDAAADELRQCDGRAHIGDTLDERLGAAWLDQVIGVDAPLSVEKASVARPAKEAAIELTADTIAMRAEHRLRRLTSNG